MNKNLLPGQALKTLDLVVPGQAMKTEVRIEALVSVTYTDKYNVVESTKISAKPLKVWITIGGWEADPFHFDESDDLGTYNDEMAKFLVATLSDLDLKTADMEALECQILLGEYVDYVKSW